MDKRTSSIKMVWTGDDSKGGWKIRYLLRMCKNISFLRCPLPTFAIHNHPLLLLQLSHPIGLPCLSRFLRNVLLCKCGLKNGADVTSPPIRCRLREGRNTNETTVSVLNSVIFYLFVSPESLTVVHGNVK